ncbi:hypothetical protein IV79_GL001684 [Pediococcus claussenii]|nr:hypothetical protein IV79_GL001684 [Pediococcus claussenii]
MKGFFTLKKLKGISTITAISTIALLLGGCVQRTKSGKPYGLIYDNLAVPTQHLMDGIAHIFGGNYGWAIILVTFIVRLILLPLMINQSRKATVQQEKMSFVQPQMKALQERTKNAKTPEEKSAVNQEMMQLYRNNNISMTGGIGCLPILIQLPVFAALYAAIQYSPELQNGAAHSIFMGINLAKPSIFLAILSFAMYFLQGWLGTFGIPKEQQTTMKSMMIVSPLMIFFFTLNAPGGLGLYFFVGGIFACIQTLIINLYRPRIRARVQEEMKKNPPKIVEPSGPVDLKEIAESESNPDNMVIEDSNNDHDQVDGDEQKNVSKKDTRRNAGKQRHHN